MKSRHFLFIVHSTQPAPAGHGSGSDWLRHYKLRAEDAAFIPWRQEDTENLPLPGDMLWMQVDEDVLARVPITHIEEDIIGSRYELWFDGNRIQHIRGLKHTGVWVSGLVPSDLLPSWLQHVV